MFKSNLLSDWQSPGRKRPHHPKPHLDISLYKDEPTPMTQYSETTECPFCGRTACSCANDFTNDMRDDYRELL